MFKLTIKNQAEKIALADIPALRQSFFGASVLIITGIVLSIMVHPYFIALPLLVSGGLLFSALAGWCPMAMIMEKMPWNK
jgi:hypothetical protein